MTKSFIIFLTLSFVLVFGGVAWAQTGSDITPTRPKFYDKWVEFLQLNTAFNKLKKAELKIKFAEKRLAQIDYLVQAGKLTQEAAERLKKQYQEFVDKAQSDLEKLPDSARVQERITKFQLQLERHRANFERVISKAPESARDALQRALETSTRGKTRLIERLKSLPPSPPSDQKSPESKERGKRGRKPEGPQAKTNVIEINRNGFSPSQTTIRVNETVKFVNRDGAPHWPASGVHPTHQICSGFDALRGLAQGESYEFKFTVAKECPMHDHLNPTLIRGKVIVQP